MCVCHVMSTDHRLTILIRCTEYSESANSFHAIPQPCKQPSCAPALLRLHRGRLCCCLLFARLLLSLGTPRAKFELSFVVIQQLSSSLSLGPPMLSDRTDRSRATALTLHNSYIALFNLLRTICRLLLRIHL